MSRRARALTGAALLTLAPSAIAFGAEEAGPIEDNSFLVEEAYNQEPRVVQHIFTWTHPRDSETWEAGFTQEWPLGGRRHQGSYTIPVQHPYDGTTGIGDVAIHYRFMAAGVDGGPVAFAPRVTWSLPSGDASRNMGSGSHGFEFNLPVSVTLGSRFVSHSNAGLAWFHVPGESTTGSNPPPTERREARLAQSLIWLTTQRMNLMLELAWARSEAPGYAGDDDRAETFVLSPGIRWAHDFDNGLQIVPGIGVPIGLGPNRGERAVLLYASFEHGF